MITLNFNKRMFAGCSAFSKWVLFCAVLMGAITLTACQPKNAEMVGGLSVEVLNYSQEAIASVMINGNKTGTAIHAAQVGGVMGGGSSCCSGEISAIKNTANVTVQAEHGTYTTQAEVELPFPPPDLMGTLIVHILPGRKVVLEVVPGATFDREDLLESQIKALGLKREVPVSDLSRTGPNKYLK